MAQVRPTTTKIVGGASICNSKAPQHTFQPSLDVRTQFCQLNIRFTGFDLIV
jgi:hypothetical protein